MQSLTVSCCKPWPSGLSRRRVMHANANVAPAAAVRFPAAHAAHSRRGGPLGGRVGPGGAGGARLAGLRRSGVGPCRAARALHSADPRRVEPGLAKSSPAIDAYLPAAHNLQALGDPAPGSGDAAQGAQGMQADGADEESAVEKVPASHAAHVLAPPVDENVPAVQPVHAAGELPPAAAPYAPAAHGPHAEGAVAPGAVEHPPGGHGVHVPAALAPAAAE